MSPIAAQLALPIGHEPGYRAVDFLEAASNADARAWLARSADWPGGRLVLFGPAGAGKTHLAKMWAAREGAGVLDAPTLMVPPAEPPTRPLVIDDADRAGSERAFLHWINAAGEAGHAVLLTGRARPSAWTIGLPDLASRVRAATAVGLGAAEDSLLRALLARLLADRQLAVSQAVQEYLLTRLPRTPGAVSEAARALDRAGLVAGRAVTRALASDVLASLSVDL